MPFHTSFLVKKRDIHFFIIPLSDLSYTKYAQINVLVSGNCKLQSIDLYFSVRDSSSNGIITQNSLNKWTTYIHRAFIF